MMYFVLVVAMLATLLWLNILYAEYLSVKINPYLKEGDKEDMVKSKIKNILVVIMALFWSAVILYK